MAKSETILEDIRQFIVVRLGNEQYGIDIQLVQNIVRMQKITRVPKSPKYIKGVVNIRGDIIPVMSIRVKFNLEEDIYTNDTRIIIVKISNEPIGIIVDEVKEVIQLGEEQIQNFISDTSDEKSNYINGVGKISNDEIVTLLNLEGVINSKENS